MLRDGLGLRDHLALRVADRRRVVHHVLDDLRARGADHRVGDLVDDRVHRVLDDGEGDGIAQAELAASGIGLLHLDGDAARARGARGAAGRDDDGGVVTLDDGGAGDSALLHRRAREEPRFDARLAAGEGDQALAAFARERAGVEAEACRN